VGVAIVVVIMVWQIYNLQNVISKHNTIRIAKITMEEKIQGTEPYASLVVRNDEAVDLISCFGTLKKLEHYYNPSTILPILDEINPNKNLLSWGGGSPSEYVSIPRNSGEKVLNLAKVIGGRLSFIFYGQESHQHSPGIYHIVVEMNGLIEDTPIQPIIYDGHLELINRIMTATRVDSYWEGDDGEEIDRTSRIQPPSLFTVLRFIKSENVTKRGLHLNSGTSLSPGSMQPPKRSRKPRKG